MSYQFGTPGQGWGAAPYQFPRQALNLSAARLLIGLPPVHTQAPPLVSDGVSTANPDGVPSINGIPLSVLPGNARDQAYIDPGVAQGAAPADTQPVVDTSKYGDAVVTAINFAGAGAIFNVLPRPATKRIELLIVNFNVVGQIFYNFDKQADNASSVPIGAGGNRLWDNVVPQNNLSIFSTGAGTVILEYMNSAV